MKLVHRRKLKMGEDKYVYPPAEALVLVQRALAGHRKIEGLAELQRDSMVFFDRFVLQQVERGEWLLFKPEARSFDWKHFEPEARHRRVMALLENPPPQPMPLVLIFRAFDNETGEWIVSEKYNARVDGTRDWGRVDDQGLSHISLPSKKAKVSVWLIDR